jgi:MFS family permease
MFRALWIAAIASNIGTWMQDVGAAWLMTSLSSSPAMVALVQAAKSLAIFFLALPAGVLADLLDRRRLLLAAQVWMTVMAALLGVLTVAGAITPWLLLTYTFALGLGAALNAPVWQAIVPEMVPRSDLPAAVSLNSASFNLARAIGPGISGLLLAKLGAGVVFLLNAASFLGVIAVVYRWSRPRPDHCPQGTQENTKPEGMLEAACTGVRYIEDTPVLKAVLLRSAAFILFGSALWALLPVVARFELETGPTGYGALVGCFGAGAVIGAVILPPIRQRLATEILVASAIVLFAVMQLALAWARDLVVVGISMSLAGAAWLLVLASFNTSIQLAVPSRLRGRAMSWYLLVFFGGTAVGSALWGKVAAQVGVSMTLAITALGLLLGLAVMVRYRMPEGAPRA